MASGQDPSSGIKVSLEALRQAVCLSFLQCVRGEEKKPISKDMVEWQVFSHLLETARDRLGQLEEQLGVAMKPRPPDQEYHCRAQPLPEGSWGRACIDQAKQWCRLTEVDRGEKFAAAALAARVDLGRALEEALKALEKSPRTRSLSQRMSGTFRRAGGSKGEASPRRKRGESKDSRGGGSPSPSASSPPPSTSTSTSPGGLPASASAETLHGATGSPPPDPGTGGKGAHRRSVSESAADAAAARGAAAAEE